MSIKPLSIMDHKKKTDDMQYLIQPRSKGWVFRMVTPVELIGKPNPWTGRPFGKEIKKGLGTRNLAEARKRRDILRGQVLTMALEETDAGKFDFKSALEWRQLIAEDQSSEAGLSFILEDKLEAASKRGVPDEQLRAFNRVALGKGYPISKAVPRYVEERKPNNARGYKPLKSATVRDLETAVKHLRGFLKDATGIACLEDVTPAQAQRFRDDYLPSVTSPRSPDGMSHKTVSKNLTLLTKLWEWAIERRVTSHRYRSPWVFPKSVARVKRTDAPTRGEFEAAQVAKLLAGAPLGSREGDIIRLALVTGCRAEELASLDLEQFAPDGSSFRLFDGKTRNAARLVPIPKGAQELAQARLAALAGQKRFFPEWPVRASSGKSAAVNQWFTRYRRKTLGKETDGTLAMHSLRHTWRTVARRARVADADVRDLGGWAGQRSSDAVYDHGLLEEQLREAQEAIWDELDRGGYLEGF